jgi:hypothetical protein
MSVVQPRKIYTRHIGLSIVGVLSGLISVLGMIQHDLPSISQYLTVTGIPAIITIADFIAARLKDTKGLQDISMTDIVNLYNEVKLLLDKFPQLSSLVPAH